MPNNATDPALAFNAANAANAAWRSGDWTTALQCYDDAARLDPTLTPAHLGRARCLANLGEWMPAREAFAAVLRLEPANYSAWLEAGHLCRRMGELQQAAGAYQHAIHGQPDRYEAHLAMARVLQQLAQGPLAQTAFAEALRCAADGATEGERPARVAEVAQRMGQYSLEAGDAQAAAQALQTGLQALPDDLPDAENRRAELRIDLGDALWRLGRREEAMAVLTAASAATTEETLVRLGALSFRMNLWQEALMILRRNVELHPESVPARWNLAFLLAECWQMEEAEQVLQQAEALGPVAGAPGLRASIASKQGDAETALAIHREMAAGSRASRASSAFAHGAAMCALYSDRLGAREVADLHRELFTPLGEGARSVESFSRPPLAGRRLKLGIVAADIHRQHPVSIFMQPVLRELDRDRIKLFLYFTGVSRDDQTRLAETRVEHWMEATALDDMRLAKRIDADGIDVLLDLSGHTNQHRMALFAQRAAPVQATYLGYPGSTGVPNMDWIIGDAIVTPPGCEDMYSERIARLPGTVFCFAPEADYPFPAYGDECARRPLTFGSFNNVPKLTPHTLRLWAEVLAAVCNRGQTTVFCLSNNLIRVSLLPSLSLLRN